MNKTTEQLLRVGVAIAFIYPAISAWFAPFAWIGYLPGFALDLAGAHEMILLHAFGVFEILIGLWVLFGKRIFIPSVIATGTLTIIIVLHANQMDVIFRDIPIALMALSLALKHRRTQSA